MVFKRVGRYLKRRYFKGKGFRNPKIGRIVRDVCYLKSVINVEKKYKDTVSAGTAFPSATGGTMVLLNGMQTGDTATTREGQSMRMKYLYVEGFVVLNSPATQDITRVAVVLDRQPNASAANFASVWDVTTASAANALRNMDNPDRFLVLKDIRMTLSSAGQNIKKFKLYIPMGRLKQMDQRTKYTTGNAGTVADISTNALYLAFGADLTANFSTIDYNCRLRFVDN